MGTTTRGVDVLVLDTELGDARRALEAMTPNDDQE
jgi:hypothetical protein